MREAFLRLRGLSPFGPIFGKELRVTSRRKRTYVLRTCYLIALLLVIMAFYAGMNDRGYYQSVIARAQRNAEMGTAFFAVFGFFSCIAMALIGPILTATAVNSEHLQKTLAVLMMTPISAWQIAAGKLFSRLLIALTLLGLSLPVLAVVRLLGGVESWQVGAALLLSFSTVIFTASIGLFFSTITRRAHSVIILSYAILILIWAVIPLAMQLALLAMSMRSSGMATLQYMSVVLPFFQMFEVVQIDNMPLGGFHWTTCVLFQLAASALMLIWASALLRRRARREMAGEASVARVSAGPGVSGPVAEPRPGRIALPPPLPVASTAPPAVPGDAPGETPVESPGNAGPNPLHASAQPARGRQVGDNPVFWREVRRPLFPKTWQRIGAVIIVLGCLVGLYALIAGASYDYSGLMHTEVHAIFACIFCGMLTVVGCVLSATAIATEKESDTWTLLLATPLSAREIVLGKFAGLLRRLLWPAVLVVANFAIFGLFGVLSPISVAVIIWITLSCNLVWISTGLYLSLRLKSTTFAAVLNLLIPITAYLGSFVLLAIADGFLHQRGDLIEAEGLFVPYTYLVQGAELTDHDWDGERYRYTGTRDHVYMPAIGSIAMPNFVFLAGFVGLVYLAIAGMVTQWTIMRMDSIVGRSRQAAIPPAADFRL